MHVLEHGFGDGWLYCMAMGVSITCTQSLFDLRSKLYKDGLYHAFFGDKMLH